jgi:hypothetical protein
MSSVRIGALVAGAAIAASAIFTPAHAEFFGCNTPKVRYYSGTPWSFHAPARQSYAAASYRVSRPVYHAYRHSYRTQW